MHILTLNNQIKTAIMIICLLSGMLSIHATTLFENFDSPSATVKSFTGGGANINYSTGAWYVYYNLMTIDDRYNGTSGLRIRGYSGANYTTMMFDKTTGGAGVVSFNYCSYSTNSGGIFTLQQSINQGGTWTDVGTAVTVQAWNGVLQTYSVPVNYNGNIRFRIAMTVTSNANTMVDIDDFQITDYGVDQTAIPMITPSTNLFNTPQNVSISSATNGATIYYTTDGSIPTVSSSMYSAPISVSQTTTIKAIAVNSGKENSRIATEIINIPIQVNNLTSLFSALPTVGTNPQYYKFTGNAIVTSSYTTSYTSSGVTSYTKYMYVQDQTAGMLINDNYRRLVNTYNQGDIVTGVIGQIGNINGIPQLIPYSDYTVSSSNNPINPQVITLANVPNYVNQIVQINNLYFDGANGTTKFAANSALTIHDASTPVNSTVVVNSPYLISVNPDYFGSVVPNSTNMICIVAKNSTSNTNYYLYPRSSADLNVPYKDPTGFSTPSVLKLSVSDGKVRFETTSVEKVGIYAVTGQQIKTFNSVVGSNSVDLASGIYIVRIGQQVSKVIVE